MNEIKKVRILYSNMWIGFTEDKRNIAGAFKGICEFDAGIWSSFVQEVVVKAKDDIRFIFKNGFEVRV